MKKIIAVLLISLLMLQSCSFKERLYGLISDDDPEIPNVPTWIGDGIVEYDGYRFIAITEIEVDGWYIHNYNQLCSTWFQQVFVVQKKSLLRLNLTNLLTQYICQQRDLAQKSTILVCR